MAKKNPDNKKNRYQKIFDYFQIEKGDGERNKIVEAIGKDASAKDLYNFLKKKTGLNKDTKFVEFAAKYPKAFPKQNIDAITVPTREEALKSVFNSDEFLMLSPENQKLLKDTISTYQPQDIAKIKVSDKEAALILKESQDAAAKEYGYDIANANKDYEETLSADITDLEKAISLQKEQLAADDAVTAENRKVLINDLIDTLNTAKSRYEIESSRKNTWLQNQLEDITYQLDTATASADEDKILQLRQLERTYNQNLRSTQNNMAARGLTFSGIRAQSEEDLAGQYEDDMTTAELIASRKKAEAERAAYEQTRTAKESTSQDIEDLLFRYGTIQKSAVRGAETTLGTSDVQSTIGSSYDIAGGDTAKSYLYGGLLGTEAQRIAELNRRRQAQSYADLSAFERQYGTSALDKLSGYGDVGYSPIGNQSGVYTEENKRRLKELQEQQATAQKEVQQTLTEKSLMGKML